jgi:hypothetical protein
VRFGRQGWLRQVEMWCGVLWQAWHGQADLGAARLVWARHGKAGVARPGSAWKSSVWSGEVWQARQYLVWFVLAGQRPVRFGRQGAAGCGMIRYGLAWQRRLGEAGLVPIRRAKARFYF